MRNAYRNLLGNLLESDHLEDREDVNIIKEKHCAIGNWL